MRTTCKPFLTLTAADLMSRDVVAIPQEMSLRAAAHVLAQSAISGAPVVDARGRCVGVLSATDFVRWIEEDQPALAVRCTAVEPICSDWQIMDLEALPTDEVKQHMTADPVMVGPPPRSAIWPAPCSMPTSIV